MSDIELEACPNPFCAHSKRDHTWKFPAIDESPAETAVWYSCRVSLCSCPGPEFWVDMDEGERQALWADIYKADECTRERIAERRARRTAK